MKTTAKAYKEHLIEKEDFDVICETPEIYARKEYLRDKGIALFQGDCLNENSFKRAFANLIITSPPYNVGIEYHSNNDKLTYGNYLDFTRQWISNCYRWSHSEARFLLNIPLDKNKGGHRSVGWLEISFNHRVERRQYFT